MPTLNYTTAVAVSKTVAEMQAMLASHGADAVVTRYSDAQPVGLSFTLTTPHGPRAFTLPVDVVAVQKLLRRQRIAPRYQTPEHAARVAWRVLKVWMAAQLAMIEAQQASLDQVMLPYLHVDGEITMYDAYRSHELRAIEAGPS